MTSVLKQLAPAEKAIVLDALLGEVDPSLVAVAATACLEAREKRAGTGRGVFEAVRYWVNAAIMRHREARENGALAIQPADNEAVAQVWDVVFEAKREGVVLSFDAISARTGLGADRLARALVLVPQMSVLGAGAVPEPVA